MIPVEICIDCSDEDSALASASAALKGGAQRLECCADMHLDGLTPSPTLVASIKQLVGNKMEVLAMIRPHEGDFSYSSGQIQSMSEGIATMATAGADGVVFGTLTNGVIDTNALNHLMKEANRHNTGVTFHRAFDALNSPVEAVQTLIDFGCHRVLTSGTPWDSMLCAVDGISNLKNIIHAAERRIEVVIGGGISAETASHLFEKLPKEGVSVHAYSSVRSGGVTDSLKVRQLVDAVSRFESGSSG